MPKDYFEYFKPLKIKKGYDEQNSLSLAVACDLAYRKKKKINQTIESWGMNLVNVISIKKGKDIDTQCYIMEDNKNIIVAFRGTDSLTDWLANIQTLQDPGPLTKTGVHEGFQDSLFPAVIALTRHLHEPGLSGRKIWITGHSLGGALCSLYTGMLIENDIDVYGVFTFASPRPGNARYERQLNKLVAGPHFRVVNDGDVIPHVPPEPFFSHPGKRIILKAHKKVRDNRSWFQQRVDALRHFVKVTGERFDVLNNHRLSADDESYIPRLIDDLNRN